MIIALIKHNGDGWSVGRCGMASTERCAVYCIASLLACGLLAGSVFAQAKPATVAAKAPGPLSPARATNAPAARAVTVAPTNALAKTLATPEDKLWASAHALLKQLKYREAGKQFDEFATKARNDPRYYSALFNRGLCELKLGQDGEAIKTWNLVLQWDMTQTPHRRVALLALDQLAGFHAGQGKADEEAKILARMKADFPDDPLTAARHAQVAGRKLKAGDYQAALSLYQLAGTNLTAADRKSMGVAEAMASTAGLTGRQLLDFAADSIEEDHVDQAIKLYATFLEQNSNSPLISEAKSRLGWCYYIKQRFDAAEKLYREVIEKGPSKDEWVGESRWQLIILTAGPRNKAEEAIKLCEIQAREFTGKFRGEQALFTRAWLYWVQKKWAEARTAFDDLILVYPEKARQPPIQGYIEDCMRGLQAKAKGGAP